MSDNLPGSDKATRPSPINGPAFLVFGLLAMVLGLGMEGMGLFVVAGIVLTLVGAAGIAWQRRYERAAGIEEVLPGRSPDRDDGDPGAGG